MRKMYFEEPEMEVVRFSPQDMLIATSGGPRGTGAPTESGSVSILGVSMPAPKMAKAPANYGSDSTLGL